MKVWRSTFGRMVQLRLRRLLISIKYAINLFTFILSYPQIQDSNSIGIDILTHSKQIRIEELYLSSRVYKCLKLANINYLSDLLNYSMSDLCQMKNFGRKCSNEVRDKLKRYFKYNFEEFS